MDEDIEKGGDTLNRNEQDEAMGHQTIIIGFLAAAAVLLMAVIMLCALAGGIDRWMRVKWGI